MTDISIYERNIKIGKRIQNERKQKGMSQTELGEAIKNLLGNEDIVAQGTISDWETGRYIPPLEKILALSKIFGCDCGYLLCDYDYRTNEAGEMCKATGLSEQSVNCLCSLNAWGFSAYADVIDFLLLDAKQRDRKHCYRSILDLLRFFLDYDNTRAPKKQVFSNGCIADYSANGLIDSNAIELNNHIIENAAIMEIGQALIDLKRIKRKADNNG